MQTLTFLFSDLENSTRLWEQHPGAMKAALERHDSLLRAELSTHGGQFVKSTGDGMLAVFPSTSQAALMAVEAQRALASEPWGETGPLRVRMSVHSGEAEQRQGDYFGQPLNRAARLMALAHGGQVLFSSAAAGLLQEDLVDDIHLIDLGEYRLKDLERPEHVYQLAANGMEVDFPPLRSLSVIPNNLPVQMTSFIGRQKEIAQVNDLLKKSRLVTLTGPGGTGKTRLSLQVAGEVFENYLDGTWLVELAPLTDPELIPLGIANALGVRELPGRSLTESIIDFLRYKNSLLILDNCEHVIETCATIAQRLLEACPKLSLIASSRESLGISGEMILRVPPLSIPRSPTAHSPIQSEEVCELQDYDAVQLFVERAQAATTEFRMDTTNARAVVQICQQLDGIPLALELAAARVRMLPPAEIAERLDDRFRLLTGGSRTALPRQQTLHALIEWSWDLLRQAEKALLRRLSVFSGGFGLQAVEDVCALNEDERWLLLDCLDDLVNKSLVVVGEENGTARFHLLETIRQFARDRLREAGESTQVRDRHRDYFTDYAQKENIAIRGREMARSLENLDREYENLRAALEWSLENRWIGVLELAGSLVLYWEERAVKGDGSYWLHAILDIIDQFPQPGASELAYRQAQHAYLLAGLAAVSMHTVEHAINAEYADAAGALARQSGDLWVMSYALIEAALFSAFLGQYDKSMNGIEEAIAIAQRMDEPFLLGRSLSGKAMLEGEAYGNLDKAASISAELASLGQRTGNPYLKAMTLFGQGMMNARIGNLDQGREKLSEGISLFLEIQNNLMANVLRSNLAHIERQSGNIRQAACLYGQTLPRWLEMADTSAVAHQFECLAYLCLACKKYALSIHLLGFAVALRQRSSNPRTPSEEVEFIAALDHLESIMGKVEFITAKAAGAEMEMEAGIQLANQTIQALMDEDCS